MKKIVSLMAVILLIVSGSFTAVAEGISETDGSETPEQAISLSSGIPALGKIEHGEDQDWYKIQVLKEGKVRVALENMPYRYEVTLYDKNLNSFEVLSSEEVYESDATKKEYQLSDPGTYYIKVHSLAGYSASKEYKLKASFPSDRPVFDSGYEPNDTKDNAYPVASGEIYKAKLDSKFDQDVYELDVKQPGQIRIWLDNLPYDYRVDLYNEDWIKINGGNSFFSGYDHFDYTTKETGKYYAVVHSQQQEYSEEVEYIFKATYPAAVAHDSAFEPNDTKETSYSLTSAKTYQAKLEYGLDIDVFKLSVYKPGHVRINFSAPPLDYDLTLYDNKGNRIAIGQYVNEASKYIDVTVTEAGPYYLHIYTHSKKFSNTQSYKVQATFPTKTVVHDKKKLESNDTRDSAYPVTSGVVYKEVISSAMDEDYYKMTLKKGESLSVSLSNLVKEYKVTILDSKGKKLAEKNSWSKKPVESRYKALTAGTYYIKVSPQSDGYAATKPYSLSVLKSKYFRPVINDIESDDTYISGEATPNMKVYILAGSKAIATGKTSSYGYYSIKIPKQKAKTKISVYTKDLKGAKSPTAATIVKL
ncbi:pre-peptidase C-terminal domain-containing protein [Peribacillus glennii]|uniref:pre-peptidase C-terminal domain-containing protein n=1 Tax=Peribacillus glennii TaxID=2303991 RepID=UPI001314D7CD|nr:pre-peptidase C-terminal domain-containing protein [Peribacillus glennii]